MQNNSIQNFIPENDLKAINRIVLLNGCNDYQYLICTMLKVFAENISPLHYIALGFVVSEHVQKTNKQLELLNLVKLCQRLN